MAQPLVCSVVEIDECLFNVAGQRIRIHRITMVLRCNDDRTRAAVLNWLIAAAMAVLELKRLGAKRFSEKLVTETHAKHRQFAIVDGSAQRFNDSSKLGWISRSVADDKAIGAQFEQLLKACIIRNLENFGAFILET